MITCSLKDEDIPSNISILTTPSAKLKWSVPMELPERPKVKVQFVICVSASYGENWDLHKIVEWMELVKILGVTNVGIYNNTLGLEVSKIFHFYNKEGLVDFRQSWKFLLNPGVLTSHLHWSPVINDCIYHNL